MEIKITLRHFKTKLKILFKNNLILSRFFWFFFSIFSLINFYFSRAHNLYQDILNKYREVEIIKIAFIGPVHSSHFKNFKKTLENNFYNDTKKTFMYVNSYPTESQKDFSMELTIDKGLYNFFGYRSKKAISWSKELTLNANHNLNYFNKNLISQSLIKFKPDFIWIHDLQSGGYLANHFIDHLKNSLPNCKVIASIWGNDLYFYFEHPLHQIQLKLLLCHVDYLHGESPRDAKIAKELGFNGNVLPESSITMTDINELESLNNNSVKEKDIFLCVKGSYYLRSNLSLIFNEINSYPKYWKNKKIVFVGSSEEDNFYIRKIKTKHKLDIDYFSWMSFEDYINFLRRSKFHLVCNLSDGILNSAAESAFTDSLPIFSRDTGLCEFLDKELISNITYDFKDVSFISLLENLVNNDILYQSNLNSIKHIYRKRVYNLDIYKEIFKLLEVKKIN